MLIPCVYAAVVALGMAARGLRLLDEHAPAVLSKILLNVTLPAAVVCGLADFGDATLLGLTVLGFGCSAVVLFGVWAVTRRLDTDLRAFYMLNLCGYNIGCFSLPVAGSVCGSVGTVAACLFDTGNALVMTGGSYTATAGLLRLQREKEGNAFVGGVLRLVRSVPFDTYAVMLVLSLAGIRLPALLGQILSPVASANGFLAMFTAGAMFSPAAFRRYVRSALIVVAVRLVLGCALASAAYFLLPYPFEVRFTVMLLAFSPVSALAPVFSEKCCGEGARSGLALSLSVVAALPCMLVLAAWAG